MTQTRQTYEPADPFPPNINFRIVSYRYVNHLQLVRYNARPKGSDTSSQWQLLDKYGVEIDIDYRGEDGTLKRECWKIVVPKGFYTDLSSIPPYGRWIVSKVGPHLEASIIHDYLYMKWTDARLGKKRFCDWVFADECLGAGILELSEFSKLQRHLVNFAVGTAGWWCFWHKKERLSEQLPRWIRDMEYLPDTPIPPDEQAPPKGLSFFTQFYFVFAAIVLLAMIVLGLGWVVLLFASGELAEIVNCAVMVARCFFLVTTGVVGVILSLGLIVYFSIRCRIFWGRRRAHQ